MASRKHFCRLGGSMPARWRKRTRACYAPVMEWPHGIQEELERDQVVQEAVAEYNDALLAGEPPISEQEMAELLEEKMGKRETEQGRKAERGKPGREATDKQPEERVMLGDMIVLDDHEDDDPEVGSIGSVCPLRSDPGSAVECLAGCALILDKECAFLRIAKFLDRRHSGVHYVL